MNHCGVVWALEIVVAVGENHRRVLRIHVAEDVGKLGLITCVWAESAIWPGSLQRADALVLFRQLLAMDVVDAEGLGEDKTRGNGRK